MLAISAVLLVRGVGIGFSFMPAMTTAFASLRPDQLSDATPQLNVAPAHRRRDRDGRAGGRAAARERAAPTPDQLAQRLRHRLLVVARDLRCSR